MAMLRALAGPWQCSIIGILPIMFHPRSWSYPILLPYLATICLAKTSRAQKRTAATRSRGSGCQLPVPGPRSDPVRKLRHRAHRARFVKLEL